MDLARSFITAGMLALVAGIAVDASAQQVYKIVGPDGRVTFSDKPPADNNAQATTASVAGVPATKGTNLAGLPFELRQAASRYPVTLYTSPGCTTCAEGRSMLTSRGIPFAEKVVASNQDIEAFKRMGATNVPLLTIGSQQLPNYSNSEWSQFLDAAGYPKTSQLPPSYVPGPATPMVAVGDTPRPAAAARQAAAAPAAAPVAPATAADNPAGIRF